MQEFTFEIVPVNLVDPKIERKGCGMI